MYCNMKQSALNICDICILKFRHQAQIFGHVYNVYKHVFYLENTNNLLDFIFQIYRQQCIRSW